MAQQNPYMGIPSVDNLLTTDQVAVAISQYGKTHTTNTIRDVLAKVRSTLKNQPGTQPPTLPSIIEQTMAALALRDTASPTPVHNLTGTILHTNLGRAYLPETAVKAIQKVAAGASNLEFNMDSGDRGDRDSHIEAIIMELTGAEAATVVNNNAAAVLLCLNTFAVGKGVCISRGELVEIGGSFRIPEVMSKSGCKLIEVGATNRTHLKDYVEALSEDVALLMKVHTSNYEIRGFTQEVSYAELADLSLETGLPLLADLGSGTLINLEQYGLPHEPTVMDVLNAGADVVTFSGDKLLGGPQCGIIAGKKSLIEQVKKNPLKRALRVDKLTIAALNEVLKLYRNPESLISTLPTIRYIARPLDEINQIANHLLAAFTKALGEAAEAAICDVSSQIGSGALPLDSLPSRAIEITPTLQSDGELQRISRAFRALPVPMIGRLNDGRLVFDLRTVDHPADIEAQLLQLHLTSAT